MFGGGDDCFSYPCKECGHPITVDPGDIGLGHALHIVKYHTKPQAGLAARNLDSAHQVRLSSVPLDPVTQQHRTNTMASTSTAPVSINPIDEPQVLPSTTLSSGTANIGTKKQRTRQKTRPVNPKLKKKIKTKISSITNQLKLFSKKCNLTKQGEKKFNKQPRCDNEAVKLLYDVSQSSSVVNKNKHMFECSVVPQFKCKLCEEFVPFDHNQQKLIDNFETHLEKHFSDSVEISSTLFTDLVHCLPFPFKNSKCWSLGSDGLLNCTVCDYSVPFTVKDMCEHLTNDIHNFRAKKQSDIVIPKKCHYWKICLQLDEEKGICLTCPRDVSISQINSHNHPSLTRLDKTDSNEQLPIKVRSFDCFHQTEKGTLLCEMCDMELNMSPSQLYDHVLGRNHNKSLWDELSKELQPKQYLDCIATSINKVYCLLCGCEYDISEIKPHLTENAHCNRELKLNLVLDELPVQYRNITCFREEQDQVVCEDCDEQMPLTAVDLHRHVLDSGHLNNMFTNKINTLNDGVRRVKCVVQFSENEVWCLICKGKFNPINIASHEHLLGDFSKLQQKGTAINFFANTLKHVRCLIQCDDKILCTICDCNVPFSFGNLIEHILGERHNKKIRDLLGQSLEEAPTLKNFVHCDLDELLCLDCNSKFPLNLDTILNHSRQTHSDILQKFKDVACLVPSQQNSLLCNICNCFVPMCVRNVFEHLLGKPHNKKIANHPEKLNCFVLVNKDEVVCLNCNCSVFASPSILSQHISDRHKSVRTPDFSNVISQQFKNNKFLIKTTDDKITCLVCQHTIPTEMKYIQTHLSEINHLTNLRSNTANTNHVIGNHARNLLNLNGSNKTTDCFLDLLKHTRCLILTDDNRAVCSICSCDVSLSVPNLLQHVLGERHNKKILARIGNSSINKSDLQNLIHCDKNYVLCLDCNAQFSLDSDVFLTHAKRSHPTTDTLNKLKDISCLAQLEQNSLFCSVCNCQVPWSTRNVLEHLLGRIHNNKILNGTGTTTNTNNFVQVGQTEVLCLLCSTMLPTSSSSLTTHLAQCHIEHDDSSAFPRVISEQFKNHKFLVTTVDNQVTCLLCQCTFPADMISVENHLSETSHTDKLNFDASTFLSGEFRDVNCFLQTDIAQVLCLVCNCFVPLSSVNLSQHLRGRKHNK